MASTVEIVIKTIDKSTKETKEVSGGFKDMAKGIGIAVAAVTASVLAMKKAIELGAEGAKFDLLGQSARNLGVDVEALQDSVGGTISEFGIMNATATLLAGTSGNLQSALVGSSDKLLEIAKAANAVNPALGDTTFLYESLGRGIKRASPLILDNLGLVVKVGDANERMAESLGKTVNELTAEEKQMALLNEVLRTGGTLIDQAAGLSTTAADAYAKLGAQGEDAANRLKAAWGVAIAPVVGGLADMIENSNNAADSVNLLKEAAESGKISWEEYSNAVAVLNVDTPEASKVIAELIEKIRILEQASGDAISEDYLTSLGIMTSATEDATEANDNLAMSASDVNAGLASTIDKYIEVAKFMKAGGTEIQKQTEKTWADLNAGIITAGQALLQFQDQAVETAFVMGDFDDMSFEEIVQSLSDMGLPLNKAVSTAQDLLTEMENINGATASLFINIVTTGSIPSGFGGAGFVPGTDIELTSAPSNLTPEQVANLGQFADGGFAKAGELAIVGERGPELFMPGTSGTVIPNGQSAAMMGGNAVSHGELMDLFSTFAAQISDAVSIGEI